MYYFISLFIFFCILGLKIHVSKIIGTKVYVVNRGVTVVIINVGLVGEIEMFKE